MTIDRVEKIAKLIIYTLLAAAMLAAVLTVKASDPGADNLPCRPPLPGEKLIATGSKDGKPFCAYYPITGWGMVQ